MYFEDEAPVYEDNDFGDSDMLGAPPPAASFLPPIATRSLSSASRESKSGSSFPSSARALLSDSARGDTAYSSSTTSRLDRPFTEMTMESSASSGAGDARARIQMLSKKNRELTAMLGGEQARSKKLSSRVSELEGKVLDWSHVSRPDSGA